MTERPPIHQRLPRAGPDREALRGKGQFWTPDWVADAMVAYALGGGSQEVFDPAVGAGAFFHAAKRLGDRNGHPVTLRGTEAFADALAAGRTSGLSSSDLANVEVTDFLRAPPGRPFPAIVGNPPYIRHHRLPSELKHYLRALAIRVLGQPLDGRAGLHVYFLIRALERLAPGGRLAFILPADATEGVFAPVLWGWIGRRFRLDAVVTFTHSATPFPQVDTNAIVVLVTKAPPSASILWAECAGRGPALADWVARGLHAPSDEVSVVRRDLSEALRVGLSRKPKTDAPGGAVLGDVAKVMRGIATGANDFFFLTRKAVHDLGLPAAEFRSAIGRTRDVVGDAVTHERIAELDAAGRPTLLLSLDGRRADTYPRALRAYLEQGEAQGLPGRALIASRRPWYKMERRTPPPFLFAYLGRRHVRFIQNLAGVVPLTGFLCVYPRIGSSEQIAALWRVLSHPDTVENLRLVGKSYGGGAIKVEPRALERLPLPRHVVADAGLRIAEDDEQLIAL